MKIEHLNYCRQIRKQLSAAPASIGASHVIDLCACTEKFILPPGGVLFDDPEYRGITSIRELKLPYPFIALEIPSAHRVVKTHVLGNVDVSKSVLFASERDDCIAVRVVSFDPSADRWDVVGSGELIAKSLTGTGPNGVLSFDDVVEAFRTPFKPTRGPGEVRSLAFDFYLHFYRVLFSFLNAVACTNVQIERSPCRGGNKKTKSALPFDDYRVLVLNASVVGGGAGGIDGGGAGGRFGGVRRRVRQHLRRGHIRRLDGGAIWVNACVVAADGGGGKIVKDYAVAVKETPVQPVLSPGSPSA